MSTVNIPDYPLPTLDRLGVSPSFLSPTIDAKAIASSWLASLKDAASTSPPSVSGILALLLPDAFWRDMFALTWDIRTFAGQEKISKFLEDRLSLNKLKGFKLKEDFPPKLDRPFEDIAWIIFMFEFETEVGAASAIVRLVPLPGSENDHGLQWKAHVIFTNLESLLAFPPNVGPRRNPQPNHGKWVAQREREIDFVDVDPKVLIIGAGQSGLDVAARLKFLDIPSLIVERNAKVGDNWRQRYEALCLHDPVWYDHMPYLPFPETWPVYTPALKLADWLEFYADALELNIWTSSTITSVRQDLQTSKWHVEIKKSDGSERKFIVNHVVFCTGLGSGLPNTPTYPGMDQFKGQILHSSEHKRATDHAGKKVVVVGACTSAHDISVDYYQHGVDVTMFQRGSTYIMSTSKGWPVLFGSTYCEGGPPVDIADRLVASFPHHMSVPVNQRAVKYLAELDKELLESLHKVGFRTNLGIKRTGFGLLAWSKAGGYYLDTGGSQLIAEGKIKLKHDSQIESFTETGIKFENGSELEADVVVFATGLGDPKGTIRRVCGDEVADKMKHIGGLDEEGEINGPWRHTGVQGLWYMMGNLALCRFHSNHIALQIKAMEEGIYGTRYERGQ